MYIPLEHDEQILRVAHRHWFFVAVRALLSAVIIALPLLCIALLQSWHILIIVDAQRALTVLWLLWALIIWVSFWTFWTLYWLDAWVITNRRLIDIDYQRLFVRNIATLRLEKIQDVTFEVHGFLGALFGYGALSVQTAGEAREFSIAQIADPEGIRDLLLEQMEEVARRPQRVQVISG